MVQQVQDTEGIKLPPPLVFKTVPPLKDRAPTAPPLPFPGFGSPKGDSKSIRIPFCNFACLRTFVESPRDRRWWTRFGKRRCKNVRIHASMCYNLSFTFDLSSVFKVVTVGKLIIILIIIKIDLKSEYLVRKDTFLVINFGIIILELYVHWYTIIIVKGKELI